jgi:hypothetical protein
VERETDTPETNQTPEVETQMENPLEDTPETQQGGEGEVGKPSDSQEVSDLSASVSRGYPDTFSIVILILSWAWREPTILQRWRHRWRIL